MTLEALYDTFYVPETTLTENDTTTSAYSITIDSAEAYTE